MPGPASPVRCPACRREHPYEAPVFPCACGTSLRIPLLRGGVPVEVRFRSWDDSWLSLRCPACGRSDQWPQPEFTCGCGATVRLPVDTAHRPFAGLPSAATVPRDVVPGAGTGRARPGGAGGSPAGAGAGAVPTGPAAQPRALARRPFLPQPVHTSDDAVLAAARYLEWLGFGELAVSDSQDREGVCLLGTRIVAQVDTWTEPVDLRAVECLWLNTLHGDDLRPVMFSLAGYELEARNRADQLLVALFALDLTGMPEAVNDSATELVNES